MKDWAAASPDHIPEGWVLGQLEDHVNSIVFDAAEVVELECALCQQAAMAGLWDRFYDPDEGEDWLGALRQRAEAKR